jgi:hypothetical protein
MDTHSPNLLKIFRNDFQEGLASAAQSPNIMPSIPPPPPPEIRPTLPKGTAGRLNGQARLFGLGARGGPGVCVKYIIHLGQPKSDSVVRSPNFFGLTTIVTKVRSQNHPWKFHAPPHVERRRMAEG